MTKPIGITITTRNVNRLQTRDDLPGVLQSLNTTLASIPGALTPAEQPVDAETAYWIRDIIIGWIREPLPYLTTGDPLDPATRELVTRFANQSATAIANYLDRAPAPGTRTPEHDTLTDTYLTTAHTLTTVPALTSHLTPDNRDRLTGHLTPENLSRVIIHATLTTNPR